MITDVYTHETTVPEVPIWLSDLPVGDFISQSVVMVEVKLDRLALSSFGEWLQELDESGVGKQVVFGDPVISAEVVEPDVIASAWNTAIEFRFAESCFSDVAVLLVMDSTTIEMAVDCVRSVLAGTVA